MPAIDVFRPRCIVSIFHADSVGLLLEHRAELAITTENDCSGQIEFFPLFSYEMLAVVSCEHEWASLEYVALSDFVEQMLITYPIPGGMLDIMRVLKPLNIFLQRRTTELTIAILQLVANGRAVGGLIGGQSYVDKQYETSAIAL